MRPLHKLKLSSFQVILLGFAAVILIGALLLMLPISSKEGAVTGSTNVELTKRCLALMGNEQELERMHQDLGALNNGNAAEIIYNRIREMN